MTADIILDGGAIHLWTGDVLEQMARIPGGSIDCVCTSPPYWSLRSYKGGWVGGESDCEHKADAKAPSGRRRRLAASTQGFQLPGEARREDKGQAVEYGDLCAKCGARRAVWGLEDDWREWLRRMLALGGEVKRVLKPTGTFWLNLGDCYASSPAKGGSGTPNGRNNRGEGYGRALRGFGDSGGFRPKDLMLIPSRVAIAFHDEMGLYIRNDIVWRKCLAGTQPLYVHSLLGPVRTTVREAARLPIETLRVPGPNGEWREVKRLERQDVGPLLAILLADGTRLKVTPDHLFPVGEMLLPAALLRPGHVLMRANLPLPAGGGTADPDLGWMAGLFLAEGSFHAHGNEIGFALNASEITYSDRLREIAQRLGARHRQHIYRNTMHVRLHGPAAVGIVRQFISGHGSKGKHFSTSVWRQSRDFIAALLRGYLDGDGHWDAHNGRWRLGFTGQNADLADDLRTACAVLGWHCILTKRMTMGFGRQWKIWRGEIRQTRSGHPSERPPSKIISVRKIQGISYEIEVDGDHLFALHNGVITHNSNHMPSSVKDRLANSYEHIFLFTKSPRYFFNLDAVRRPHASVSDRRFSVGYGSGQRTTDGLHREGVEEQSWHPNGANPGDVIDETNPWGGAGWRGSIPGGGARIVREQDPRWLPPAGANPGDVLEGPTASYGGAHYAVFPEYVPEFALKAGCPQDGICLDPFMGTGTTLAVAARLGLHGIGIDLSAEYTEMARERIERAISEREIGVEPTREMARGQALLL